MKRLFLVALTVFTLGSCKNESKEPKKVLKELAEKPANPQTFQLDPSSSTVNWTGSKPTGSHHGNISFISGEFHFNNTSLVSGQIKIDMSSIKVLDSDMTADKKQALENHLKGVVQGKETDFFDIKKFPTASFGITEVKNEKENILIVGNLSIKDKTHQIKIPAKISWAADSSSVKIISEKFYIDRTKWGVNYGSKSIFKNLGDQFINDEIGLQIYAKARPK